MLFYIAIVDGKPTCFKESEHAFEHVSKSDNWFVCANSDGKVTLCGHSIGAFDGIDNSAILARLKKHFAKRSIA